MWAVHSEGKTRDRPEPEGDRLVAESLTVRAERL